METIAAVHLVLTLPGIRANGDDDSAWYQYFFIGNQGSSYKGYKLLARAVRRIPI